MFFKFYNISVFYQRFMNDNFLKFKEFVSVYIDNFIIFFKIKKEYKKHVKLILKRLRDMKLYINILKTEFYMTEIKYLKMIISL